MTDQREPGANQPTGDDARTGEEWPQPATWVREAGAESADPPETAPDQKPTGRGGMDEDFDDRSLAGLDRRGDAANPGLVGADHDETRVTPTLGQDRRTRARYIGPDQETQVLEPETKAYGSEAETQVFERKDAAAPMGGAGLFRDEDSTVAREPVRDDAITRDDARGDDARLDETALQDETDPEADRAAERAATRAERNRALGKVSRPAPEPPPMAATVMVRNTDKWYGSLGLFVLRLILAAIFFVRGLQHLTALSETQQFIDQNTVLPYPEVLGWVLAVGELLIAVSLVFGFLVRVAGLAAMATAVMALVFVLWGASNPFQSGMAGFVGELPLLITGVGLLFLLLGGGRWSIDGAMRKRRRLKKEAAAVE